MKIINIVIIVVVPLLVFGIDSSNVHQNNVNDSTKVVEPFVIQPQVSITNDIPEESTDYFGAIMPLLTLVLGFILNKWYDNYTRKKELKEKGTEWVQSFVQLKTPLEDQVKSLEEYIPNNDENTFQINDLPHELYLDCQIFKSLDEKSLVRFLSKGSNKLSYRGAVVLAGKLRNTVELIELSSKRYRQTFEIFKSETSNYISLFNTVFNDFKIKVTEYHTYAIGEFPNGAPELVEALKMQQLMVTHIFPNQDTGEYDLFQLGEYFVKPFFKTTYVDNGNPIIQEINKLLNMCDRYIKAAIMEKKYFRIKLEKELDNYKKHLESVNKLLENKKVTDK